MIPSRVTLLWLCAFASALAPASRLHAQARYILQDLGKLPDYTTSSSGSGVSASGQVVGLADGTGSYHAFLTGTDGQTLNDLGTLAGAITSSGRAVSPDGQVAGDCTLSNGKLHAFWRDANGGPLVDLGTLPGHTNSLANGVNSSGMVVGYSYVSSPVRAFVSAPGGGALTDIGTLGGNSAEATGINSSGRITGSSSLSSGGPSHAFLTDASGTNMKDLGNLPSGNGSRGQAVNDVGQVAGSAGASNGSIHAFMSAPDGGALTDLGFFTDGIEFTEAKAINNKSEVVGWTKTLFQGFHGFVYTTARGMEDLNDLIDPLSGFIVGDATGLNDRGQISGSGRLSNNGPQHAFLLTPGIPDPARLGLTFSGGSASAGSGGFSFTALGNIKITQLAVFDTSSDGLAGSMNVTLTGPNNQVLVNVTIPAGTTARLMNGFRYVALPTPLLIPAGPEVYTISSTGSEPVIANASSISPGFEIATTGGTVLGPNFLYITSPLTNADFEIGPFTTLGTVTGWTVTGDVADINQGATSGSHDAAFSAGDNSEGNTLSQTFFSRPNLRYTLDFDAGVSGQRSGDPLQLQAQVIGNTTVLTQTVAPPEAGTFDPALVTFQHYQFDFVADSPTSTQTFTDIGLGNAVADVVLDKVILVPAPPSYSAWQALYFNDSQQNDLTISGPGADPDKDGLPNGFEFYFNFNPVTGMTSTERAALPQLALQTNNANLSYRRRIGSGGVIGFSNDLQVWDERDVIQPTGTTVATGDNVTETFTATVPAASPQFYRLTLPQTHPPSASQWKSSAGGNNHWYELVKTPKLTWSQARDYAVNHGGYLATITSSAENDFIRTLFANGTAPFIGGYSENNVFRWVTGETFSYTNWQAGEPNNFNGVEDCAQFLGATGQWNDTSKNFPNAFIVEYPN